MRDFTLARWLQALLSFLIIVPAVAQQYSSVPANEQRVALVIGNSAYKDSPLANPVNDATDMASALQSMGFKVILKRDAGTREMRQAIRDFNAELRRAQVGLFYFAGHGVQVKGANYLIPVGADIQNEADVEDLAIDASYALRMMEEAQVKVSIVVLDACRNNPFARSFRSASRGLAQMTAATGSLIAFATAPGSVASDGSGRNGVYTKHLLDNLRHHDTDILKVFQRTRANVVQETGGRQTPWESTSLVGDFYFRPLDGARPVSDATQPAAQATPVKTADPSVNDRAFWDSVKDSKNPEELKAYLKQFPNGLFVSLAEARLQALQSERAATAPSPSSMGQPAAGTPGFPSAPASTTSRPGRPSGTIEPYYAQTIKPYQAQTIQPYRAQPALSEPLTNAGRQEERPVASLSQPAAVSSPEQRMQAPAPICSFTGHWAATNNWGTLSFAQEGGRVSGKVTGGWAQGSMGGSVSGNVMSGTFQREGRTRVDGQVELVFSSDCRTLSGKWKWNESPVWAASAFSATKTAAAAVPKAKAEDVVGTWYGVAGTVGTIVLHPDGRYTYNGNPGGRYAKTGAGIDFTGALQAWGGGHATLKGGNLEFYWTAANGGKNWFAFSR